MHTTTPLLAALLSASTCTAAAHGRRDDAPRVVSMRTRKEPITSSHLDRRNTNNTLDIGLTNQKILYTVEASMGTPPQKIVLQLDTGSADLWIPAANWCENDAAEVQDGPQACKAFGSYSANDSSTYEYLNSNLVLGYVDNSRTTGDFATDVFTIGGVSVQDMQFGIGYNISTDGFTGGIIGISYANDEGGVIEGVATSYPNFPAVLVNDGLIRSQAYSLYLDSAESHDGTVLFGGIDTERFEGQLQTVSIIADNGVYRDLQIALDSISVSGGPSLGPDGEALVALLDSGTSYTYIPDDIITPIYDQFSITYDNSSSNSYVDCDLGNQNTSIIFSFSGANISVPMSEVVLDSNTYAKGGSKTGQSGICAFGILPMSGLSLTSPILGDTFLRSAYVVYDLDNNEISLAQARYNAGTESNILEIGEGPNAVPQATGTGSGSGGTPDSGNGNAAAGLVAVTQVTWAVALLHLAALGWAAL
ncbi:aspartic peptidase domain-containing protein [Plectosphaerella plurivora]|uniref:Aspartic peptidase domain-containing protein n=1 Tax=Plectosphaerella plurivora TaxID=936078 RepID=A0A9P8VIZ4_9PEZI|nr:aspartic peptidase domain-containing protein [Plectosphaerella plurivora]